MFKYTWGRGIATFEGFAYEDVGGVWGGQDYHRADVGALVFEGGGWKSVYGEWYESESSLCPQWNHQGLVYDHQLCSYPQKCWYHDEEICLYEKQL